MGKEKMIILHIHVKRIYWLQAQQGIKDEEYREIKPYWTDRLIGRLKKDYTHIYYWLAYTDRKMIFKYNGFKIKNVVHVEWDYKPKRVFAIPLEN